jgi:hypothetical protein
LQERGEKLSQLQTKTAGYLFLVKVEFEDMENNALNFLKMTEEIRKREQNKKWYEL